VLPDLDFRASNTKECNVIHGTGTIRASLYYVLEDAKTFSWPTNKHVRLLSKTIAVIPEGRMNFLFRDKFCLTVNDLVSA
jgi:hypothetical protein